MPNTPITMSKLRTIIRLYEDRIGLKTISTMARTSRNTVKKHISKWNTLGISYEEFQSKSDAELNILFCIPEDATPPNPRREELESLLPSICKELGKRGMTTPKRIERADLLILDDFGMQTFDSQGSGIMMDIIEDRHQRRTTMITSQVPVKNWHGIIEEKTVADAILDRLVHHSLRVELFGESIRKRKTKSENTYE